ncbi:MAG: bifunctional riboflavin kinase/FAD synthetase [Streptosporangiales bacterium]|nr:bifunctional riboflavin kinase/FAD synthetase [Streptosporangiales bacterium]
MPLWHGFDEVPEGFGPSVVTIGVFDGVHRGHARVVGAAAERARAVGAQTVVVTFHPHPQSVIRPDTALPLLSLPEHRAPLAAAAGADAVLVLPFTAEMSKQAPEDFVADLVRWLRPTAFVVGDDFRFGHKAAGDVQLLAELGQRYGYTAEIIPAQGDVEARFSSSRTRAALLAGDVAVAAEVLGRPFAVSGVVVEGAHRGRELGFPTANLMSPQELVVPADGIYAGWLERAGGSRLPAAISVGTNPQFHGAERQVEAYCLDRDDLELYGERVRVEFVARVRGQQVFDSVDALVEQMKADVDAIRELLGST